MYKSAKFGLVLTVTYLQIYIHYLTVTLLNNSVELSSNLDPEPLNELGLNSDLSHVGVKLELRCSPNLLSS